MKVLGISCSPRKNGNTEILLGEALDSAKQSGAETLLWTVRGKNLKPCDGCFYCVKTGECHVKDDMQELYELVIDYDAMIWGTPVYFFDATAQAKILIDRLFNYYMNMKLANKVGGIIAVASSLGHYPVFNLFQTFFLLNHMLVADFVYGFAPVEKVIRRDRHAMQAARALGAEVVALLQKNFKYPENFELPIYRLITKNTGIHMSPSAGRFNINAKKYTKYY